MKTNENELYHAYKRGQMDMKKLILHKLKEADINNAENIRQDPQLASFLLLELIDQIQGLEVGND